ncbi:Magnesium transporter NIPA [Macleaya cordata]|uniref:Magnesium transporter NIPA n=1 Tax=Macleaya cordata TaxID=56857 RepID=A0A200RDH7_MACCD|nr:Magnesium transporter NIPA [Macleaya cordata]
MKSLVLAVTSSFFIGSSFIVHNKGLKATQGSASGAVPRERIDFDDKDLESEESLWNLYGRWMSYYQVTHDPKEKQERFKIFKENVHFIHDFRKNDNSFGLALNKFADISGDEYARDWMGCRVPIDDESD